MRAISKLTNNSNTYLHQAFILNKGSILGLFFLLFFGSLMRAQSVAVDFPSTGCSSDSILIKLKPEFEYGKFVINDGVKTFWASEYKAAYQDEEKIILRGFYEDNSEVQSTYYITSDNNTCPVYQDLEDKQCIEKLVQVKLANDISSAKFSFSGIPGLSETDTIYLDQNTNIFEFTMPRNDVQINYSAITLGGIHINSSQLLQHQYVILARDTYCAYEVVEIKECTCSETVTWSVDWFEPWTETGPIFYFENIWNGDNGTTILLKYPDGFVYEFTIYLTGDGYGEDYLEGEVQKIESSTDCSSVDIIINSGYDNYIWALLKANDWYSFETNTETLSLSINFFKEKFDLNVEGRIFDTCDQLYISDVQIDNIELNQAEIILDDNLDEIQGCNDSLFVTLDDLYENISWQILNSSNGQIEASGSSYVIATYLNDPELELEIYASDSNGNCVNQTKILNLDLIELNPIEPCLITSSPETPNNLIRWNNTNNSSVEMYLLYREAINLGNYVLLDSFSNTTNSYLDLASQSGVQSYKYKLQVKDICGNYSSLEETDYHKTLHLTSNQGINGEINLIWEEYEGLLFDNVIIYRQTDENNPEVLAQIPAGLLSYTDLNPPSGILSYSIQLGGDFACNSIDYAVSSNVVQQSITSNINDENEKFEITLYPNPSYDNIFIQSSTNFFSFSILDLSGSLVLSGNAQNTIDISNLISGTYFLTLKNDDIRVTKRFIKL